MVINKFSGQPCRVFFCKDSNPDVFGKMDYQANGTWVMLRGRVETTGMFVCSRKSDMFPMVVSTIEELPNIDYTAKERELISNAVADSVLGETNG